MTSLARRPSSSPSPASRRSTARARSCASRTAQSLARRRRGRSHRARSASTSRSASAATRAGRIVEIYGPESSGKTTLTLHAIARCRRQGGVAAFIDAEHALDPTYARKLGVKTDELLVSQPDYGEQALEIADMLVRSNAVDLVVVDSVAALVPKAEIEGDMGDSHVGLQARLMSQALRKLTGTVARSQLPARSSSTRSA